MKKLALTMVGLAMVLFIATTAFTVPKNDPTNDDQSFITYLVKVDAPSNFGTCAKYYVTMTDVDGRNIAPPQMYQGGISTYVFREHGPYTGIRIANLVKSKVLQSDYCLDGYVTDPDVKWDTFLNSKTYLFYLHPYDAPDDND